MAENIIPFQSKITKNDRRKLNNQHSFVLWFTGLSGSGKSTVANEIEKALHKQRFHTYYLDGDNIRNGINNDLNFSKEDRNENIRRISEIAKLFVDAGVIVLSAFISPFKEVRNNIRNLFEEKEFIEVYVECPIKECERRDVKGLYKKAREGEIKDFTGISSPYEAPENPEIIINTHEMNLNECVKTIIQFLTENKYL